MPTVHLLIKGKVQGVFYRANTKKKADELGVFGWVKNMPDETVEVMASGSAEALDAFIAWCRKGSDRAKVTGVTITQKEESWFNEFIINR